MPPKNQRRKGDRQTTPKQVSSSGRKLGVTKAEKRLIDGTDVTLRHKEKPLQRYKELREWLDLVNLLPFEPDGMGSFLSWQPLNSDDVNHLRAAFDKQLQSIALAVFDQLRESNRKLEEAYRVTRCFLESVPAMDWSSQAEEVSFPIPHYASGDADGRIVFQAEPLLQIFRAAIQGAEIRRLGRCPICGKFFYAVRSTQKTCSQRCNATRRVRAWRANMVRYEYSRKLKLAGVKQENEPEHRSPRKEDRK
jgi:predicted nucleic acid-binding Zn ribbon protein